MEGAVGAEFQDWEVLLLHDSDPKTALTAVDRSTHHHFGGIEGEFDSDTIIKSDYFSLDNQGRRAKSVAERDLNEEEASIESDNPSWIDPSSENRYSRVNSGEFWSDSASDRSDERKSNEFDSKTETDDQKLEGLVPLESEIELAFEEFDENQPQNKDLSKFCSDSAKFEEIDQSDSQVAKLEEINEHFEEEKQENLQIEESKVKAESGEKRKIVWWKVPFEMLKYCMFRAGPVWSFSVAAAVMGFIILGRKLYKMKRKSQSLLLKVTLDDKKASQFMSRAARLNEAFSVVRRVPIVRPTLPAAGINPWPAISMR